MQTFRTAQVAVGAIFATVVIGLLRERAEAAEVVVNPGDNIQALVNGNPGTTTFLFSAGIYRGQSIVPKNGNVFDGQGGATLDGMNLTPRAFGGTADNVTIKNLTIKSYKSAEQHAAVDAEFGNAWIIRNNTITLNRHVGVNFGNNTQVIGNNLSSNGQAGFAGGGAGWLVENNQINNNNTLAHHHDWHFEAGGGKVTEATSGTFRGNTVTGNDGPGIWLDENANNILVENNTTSNNLASGIMVEISRNATVRYNTASKNGDSFIWEKAQILISSAEDNEIYGNIIDTPANRGGIFVMSQDRDLYAGINNEIYENEVYLRGLQAGVQGVDTDISSNAVYTTNNFRNNTYFVASLSTKYFSWQDDYTFSQAQSNGKEIGSTVTRLLPGDFDNDGDVDGRDFLLWQRDSSVGDLADWQANYGTASLVAAVAVPEPTMSLLWGVAITDLTLRRRRR